ncbi:MAG: GNAT family N-acetyltransferase [Actinomycetota bacterium]|nr:GNAT family N-acetyltransferase [Actinomycetota bacterium]
MADKGVGGEITTLLYRDDLPAEWEGYLWEKYRESFGFLDTYQDQVCYDRESFLEALRDPRYLKFVVLEDGAPRGLALATNDLERASVAYINPEYIRKRFPRQVEEGRFYYVTTIYVDPAVQGMGLVKSMLRSMLSYMREGNRIAGFDFCQSKEFLAGLIEDLSRDPEVNIPVRARRLDAQIYYVLELEP